MPSTRGIRQHLSLVAVLAVGLVTRAILIPITHGQDFVVWDLASSTTLRGVNIYAHHPLYPGGPYAYFPFFLDVELPFQWVAMHTGFTFNVLGKLPILAADVTATVLIAAEIEDRTSRRGLAAVGAGLFFLNPLLIYNSAYYGRFDSIGCALLLLALRYFRLGARKAPWFYALAVAAKTFPGFLVPGVVRSGRQRMRIVVALIAVLVVLTVPYVGSLTAYKDDIVMYDVHKVPQGMSWQTLLWHVTDGNGIKLIGYVLLGAFAIGTVSLAAVRDLDRYTILTLFLFLLCSKLVLEQYLLWPMPWLVLAICTSTVLAATASAAIMVVLTTAGMLANESFHPWGRSPAALDLILAGGCCVYWFAMVYDAWRTRSHGVPLAIA